MDDFLQHVKQLISFYQVLLHIFYNFLETFNKLKNDFQIHHVYIFNDSKDI